MPSIATKDNRTTAMDRIEQLLPNQGALASEDLLAHLTEIRARPHPIPFAPELLDLCAAFSKRLLADKEARRSPALQALGFWMRPTAIHQLRTDFEARQRPQVVSGPRGLAFHLPPTNVDTLFVYSWLLSFLTGNHSVIRLSPNRPPSSQIILRLLAETLADCADFRRSLLVISYGHDDQVTTAISAQSDVRVIWGGDVAVRHLRTVPASPHCVDLCFPDRFSMAAIKLDAFVGLTGDARRELVERFFNDMYWFDQMACSSPRLLVWVGDDDAARQAAPAFCTDLARVARSRGYQVELGTRLAKMSYAYRAMIDQPIDCYQVFGPELSVLTLRAFSDFRGDTQGGGTLVQLSIQRLAHLADALNRKDQTLAHFGFAPAELEELVASANGRGLDRLVPIGDALSFQPIWDGFDLVEMFTRKVTIRP